MGKNYKKESKLFYGIQIIVDILLVNLGFYTAYLYRFGGQMTSENIDPYVNLIPLISLTTFIFFNTFGVFRWAHKPLIDTVYSVFLSLIFIEITTMAMTFFNRGFSFPRSIFFISFAIQLIYLFIWKFIIHKVHYLLYKKKKVLILADESDSSDIAKKIILEGKYQFEIKYICEKVNDNIYKLIEDIDVVIIGPKIDNKVKEKIISKCIGLNKIIYIVPELFEITLSNARLTQIDDIPAFYIENIYLSQEQRILKRTFDIIVSLIGIIISSPIMLICYILIRLYDHGPAIYSQERVTRNNKKFKLYKFRTMVVDAEKLTGPVLATDKDDRITPIGAILRSTRLDELPQLFNVLIGDMSIVGPRPERQYFIDQFKQYIPDFEYRLTVKAGITGLAQVLGKYSTTPEDKLRYDLLYIRNYSFLLDLRIILQTIKIMFMKSSSQGLKKEKTVEELLKSMNYNVYKEVGVTRLEKV